MTVPKAVEALSPRNGCSQCRLTFRRRGCAWPYRGKLAAARKIASIDVEVAYVTGYDAARIAVTAHMLAKGYRARAVAGAHEAVGIYTEAMLDFPSAGEFQRMRRRRNKAEYDDIIIGQADLSADLEHAQAIINAVQDDLQ